jgi:hypothetical protein
MTYTWAADVESLSQRPKSFPCRLAFQPTTIRFPSIIIPHTSSEASFRCGHELLLEDVPCKDIAVNFEAL